MSGFQRQQRFRQRQAAAGQIRFELWLDSASAATLERWAAERAEATRKARLTAVVVAALQALTAPAGAGRHSLPVDAQPQLDAVTGNAQSDTATLETRVLELHNRGLTLAEMARALALEGFAGPTGKPYHPSSIGRIKERALQRR